MPLGRYQDILRADPGGSASPRFWHRLSEFRRFCSGSLALTSLDLACWDQSSRFSATLTTTAFDRSSSRWLGISDLIAEPEGSSFIFGTVAQRRVDRRYSWRKARTHRTAVMSRTSAIGGSSAVGALSVDQW